MNAVIISAEEAQLFKALLAQARDSAKLQKAVDTSYLECIETINKLRQDKTVHLLFEVDEDNLVISRHGLGVFESKKVAEEHAKENGYHRDKPFSIVEVIFNKFQLY